MTLRQRLAVRYGAVVAVALLVLTAAMHHEFDTEGKLRPLLTPVEAQKRELFDALLFSLIPVILIGGWWLTRRSLAPITDLAKAVERVQADNLRQPLPRSGNGDEIDRLTETFNAMTARLDASIQHIREFTLHASHELKTPLTVMRGELETALAGAPQQTECLHNLLEEVQRLTQIVNALTLLTKADAGQVDLKREPVKLAELVRESFEDAQILAESNDVQVTLHECDKVLVAGDRHRLRQLLLNLVDNAVKYNHAGGNVTMALRQVNGAAEIEITNTGVGIPASLQPRVFDRFVRGDNATEGCGLGLTIAQWIAHAHGGTIQISSESGKTTTIVVQLPLLTSH